jgi:hypothetical protein
MNAPVFVGNRGTAKSLGVAPDACMLASINVALAQWGPATAHWGYLHHNRCSGDADSCSVEVAAERASEA